MDKRSVRRLSVDEIHDLVDSFVCDKESDTSKTTSHGEPEVGPILAMDRAAFYERVHSFSSRKWFAKPLWLSPIVCAAHGWQNVDEDLLQCVTCMSVISGRIVKNFTPQIRDEVCERVKASLESGHSKCCPWTSSPSPESVYTEPPVVRSEALSEYQTRVDSLLTLNTDLPLITTEHIPDIPLSVLHDHHRSQSNGDCSSPGSSKCSQSQTDVYSSACVLALTGWERSRSSASSNQVECQCCQRSLGLWNFITVQSSIELANEEEDKELDDRVLDSSIDTQSSTADRPCNTESVINGGRFEPEECQNGLAECKNGAVTVESVVEFPASSEVNGTEVVGLTESKEQSGCELERGSSEVDVCDEIQENSSGGIDVRSSEVEGTVVCNESVVEAKMSVDSYATTMADELKGSDVEIVHRQGTGNKVGSDEEMSALEIDELEQNKGKTESQMEDDSNLPDADSEMKLEDLDSKLADSQAKPADSQTKLAGSEMNIADSLMKLTDSETEHADTEMKPTDSEVTIAHSEMKPTDSEVTIAHSEMKPTDSEVTIAHSEMKTTDSEVTSADSEMNPTDSEVTIAESEMKLTDSEVTNANSEITVSCSELVDVETEICSDVSGTESKMTLSQSDLKCESEINVTDVESEIIAPDNVGGDLEVNCIRKKRKHDDTESVHSDIKGSAPEMKREVLEIKKEIKDPANFEKLLDSEEDISKIKTEQAITEPALESHNNDQPSTSYDTETTGNVELNSCMTEADIFAELEGVSQLRELVCEAMEARNEVQQVLEELVSRVEEQAKPKVLGGFAAYVAGNLSVAVDDGHQTKRRKVEVTQRHIDPVSEHQPWCPWVHAYNSAPGWKLLLQHVQARPHTNIKHMSPVDGLHSVRTLMKNLTSPS